MKVYLIKRFDTIYSDDGQYRGRCSEDCAICSTKECASDYAENLMDKYVEKVGACAHNRNISVDGNTLYVECRGSNYEGTRFVEFEISEYELIE